MDSFFNCTELRYLYFCYFVIGTGPHVDSRGDGAADYFRLQSRHRHLSTGT